MGNETLLKEEYMDDPELQRENGESSLEWVMRTDAIMFGREARKKVKTDIASTHHVYSGPVEACSSTRNEASGLLSID